MWLCHHPWGAKERGRRHQIRVNIGLILIRSGLLSKRGIIGEEDCRGGGDNICGGAAVAAGGARVGW